MHFAGYIIGVCQLCSTGVNFFFYRVRIHNACYSAAKFASISRCFFFTVKVYFLFVVWAEIGKGKTVKGTV